MNESVCASRFVPYRCYKMNLSEIYKCNSTLYNSWLVFSQLAKCSFFIHDFSHCSLLQASSHNQIDRRELLSLRFFISSVHSEYSSNSLVAIAIYISNTLTVQCAYHTINLYSAVAFAVHHHDLLDVRLLSNANYEFSMNLYYISGVNSCAPYHFSKL